MQPARHRLRVGPEAAGLRLDAFVATGGILASRSQARHLIDAGRITVEGTLRKAGYQVRAGEVVEIDVPPALPPVAEPEDLALDVLYEDATVIAINKAPGMVVHPAPGCWQGTLVNALLHRWGRLPSRDEVRPGIVHRLDRETSGVMVVARTLAALEHLARQFHDRTVAKRYLAVVWGVVRADQFVVDAAIGRHPVERKKMSTRARGGRTAVTRFRTLERFKATSLVEAAPETGRTHQIRVHLAARGHPVVGDRVYGGARDAASIDIGRHALHAASLTLHHPVTEEALSLHAPLLPDMRDLIARLRAARDGILY